MVITIPVKLVVSKELDEKLSLLASEQSKCANYFVEVIKDKQSTSLKDLSGEPYFEAKRLFKLGSNLIQFAGYRAVTMMKVNHKTAKHSSKFNNVFLSLREIKIDGFKVGLIFSDGSKRTWVEYLYKEPVLGTTKESILKKINGEWFCYLRIDRTEPKPKNYKRFMGVDLGIAKTAVTCDWNGKHTRFFNGEPYRFKKNHFMELRKGVEPKLKQGNVYKFLKRISKHEANWVTNENHKISREIVNMAIKNKRSIALEKLTGITERLKVHKKSRKMLKGWSFRQLADFIEYKAKLAGITVVYVDPRGTSKTCPKCQYCSRSNRRTQSLFKCRKCNYESNADRIGAINIAIRGNTVLSA
jgi:IS605 OrfB family transposase